MKNTIFNLSTKRILAFVLALTLIFSLTSCEFLESLGLLDGTTAQNGTTLTPDGTVQVHFIDVGNADAILLESSDGKFMLIDAGDNTRESRNKLLSYLDDQGVKALEYVIFTHPHADHIGGAKQVVENYEIKNLIMSNAVATTVLFENMLLAIEEKGLEYISAQSGEKYSFGGGEFQILAPNSKEYTNLNNYSVVIKYTFGKKSFLFCGDAEILSEDEMLEKYKKELNCDVIKVGHHGSDTSSGEGFISAVSPEIAVIPTDGEEYGHPSLDVIALLKSKGAKVYRNDLHGNIIVTSDGEGEIAVQTEKTE